MNRNFFAALFMALLLQGCAGGLSVTPTYDLKNRQVGPWNKEGNYTYAWDRNPLYSMEDVYEAVGTVVMVEKLPDRVLFYLPERHRFEIEITSLPHALKRRFEVGQRVRFVDSIELNKNTVQLGHSRPLHLQQPQKNRSV